MLYSLGVSLSNIHSLMKCDNCKIAKKCKKLRNQERRKYFVTALDGQIHEMIATVMLVPHNIYFTILLSYCYSYLLFSGLQSFSHISKIKKYIMKWPD